MPLSTPTVAPTAAEFLKDYPAFDSTAITDPNLLQFSGDAITYWLNLAVLLLNQDRWGNLYYLGVELFMAHNLALEAWAAQGPKGLTVPGIAKGAIAGKSAGDVSVAYDTASVLELGAGHWNYTVYGKRFIRLVNMAGAGPIQIGPCGVTSGGAWAGPPFFNFPNPSQ